MSSILRSGLLAILVLGPATACGTSSSPAPSAPEQLADEEPTALRLPGFARPLAYTLELVLDPDADGFRGTMAIELELAKPTRTLWLNSEGLTIDTVSLAQGDRTFAATTAQHTPEVLKLTLAEPLASGRARVTLSYSGVYENERTEGIYRVKEADGANHVYSMFEPQFARRAFPHFDEPAHKVTWNLSFQVRQGHTAVANSPVKSTTALEDGMQRIEMVESRPMPSYLVAFMAGPFEIVDAGTAGKYGTPLRFIIPKGRAGELGYAREATPRIVTLLEDYFGMQIPYRKLDVAVVPRFWGTMEHPGIVAMGQPLTLIKPEEDSPWRRIAYANIAIHELCHYWFGDYVTMKWWDDAWLNEGLGTWCDGKITEAFEPSWRTDLTTVDQTSGAMGYDEAPSAKTVRSPIRTAEDIEAAFDGSTYDKGGAVTRMFEMYVGPDRFRDAIRAYLAEHAWGSATTESFLAALDRKLPGVGTAMGTFLEQNGAPLLTFDLTCSEGTAPTLAVKQERVTPLGVSRGPDQQWSFPVCVRYGSGTSDARTCHLLTKASDSFPLEGSACPAWFVPNAGASGYYRSKLGQGFAENAWQAGFARASEPEQVSLVADLSALSRLGALEVGDALALVPELAKSKTYILTARALGIARSLEPLVTDAQRPRYQAWLRSLFGARARSMGWSPVAGEKLDDTRLRSTLLSTVGGHGAHKALRKRARALAAQYLENPEAVHDSMVRTVLYLAAIDGDAALFDAFLARAKAAKDHRIRKKLFSALGGFTAPELAERAQALPLDASLDLRDTRGILWSVLYDSRDVERGWRFITANFDALAARMTEIYIGSYLVSPVSMLCDPAREAEIRAFYKARLDKIGGAQLNLDNALDDARTCAAWRAFQGPSAKRFLDALPGAPTR